MHFFLTGTGTDVGKTHLACRWIARLRAAGRNAVGLKPIGAGDRADAEALRQAAGNALTLDEVNPCALALPMAPWAAARIAGAPGHEIDFDQVNAAIDAVLARFPDVVVEGVGGWRVPLADKITVAEWAQALRLPAVVVAPAGLGAINHVLLTLESMDRLDVPVLGVVLNPHGAEESVARATNREALARWTHLPVIELTATGDLPAQGAEWLLKP